MESLLKLRSSGMKFLTKPKDATDLGLLVAAAACAIIPFDISQLVLAIAGALACLLLQFMQSKHTNQKSVKKTSSPKVVQGTARYVPKHRQNNGADMTKPSTPSKPMVVRATPQPDVRKPSNVPILPPTFTATDWDQQIAELLVQISPTVDDDKIVGRLAGRIKQAIQASIPEVEVVGFASGSLARNKAFGVAVPEVDIVANIDPAVLMKRVSSPAVLQRRMGHASSVDVHKLRKSAIRVCTESLVSSGGFKFRRSAFRGEEPKVTLLAPASFGLSNDAIPIDFSVNASSPLHNAALLTECGQMEPRARALILIVKRWAKDRGICHAAKGHLSPYVWGILSIFFLQVGQGDQPFLPKLAEFKMASGLMKKPQSTSTPRTWTAATNSDKTVGTLFKEFIHFYNKQFNWQTEAVSIRAGSRQKPAVGLPLHIIVHENGTSTEVGPSIEDPFDDSKNLGTATHSASLQRLREELARADELNTQSASLETLLEPWAPPETPEQISE